MGETKENRTVKTLILEEGTREEMRLSECLMRQIYRSPSRKTASQWTEAETAR